jgi:hypothetical protein
LTPWWWHFKVPKHVGKCLVSIHWRITSFVGFLIHPAEFNSFVYQDILKVIEFFAVHYRPVCKVLDKDLRATGNCVSRALELCYCFYLLIFHCNSGCKNASQCYVTRTLPVLLDIVHWH